MFQMRKLFNVIAFRQMYDSLEYPLFKTACKDLFNYLKPRYTTKNVSYSITEPERHLVKVDEVTFIYYTLYQ